jgi:tungstate transport system ATP-binding protein
VRLGNHTALSSVNLSLMGTRRVAILGANGAGKTVLLRTLHGLIPPTEGTVTWAHSILRPANQAMVFQRPVLLRRTVLENVEYALAARGVIGAERMARAHEALAVVGLLDLVDRQARVLSGGEQQRLSLARAWAVRPRILFLDEPTTSLDPATAAEIERVIHRIHSEGTTTVTTTHVLGLARRIADDVIFLHQGRLLERTPVERFFASPQTPEADHFLKGELPWTVPLDLRRSSSA